MRQHQASRSIPHHVKPFGGAVSRRRISRLPPDGVAGSLGGAERIVVSQLADAGAVKVFSSGSALDLGPAMYLHSPSDHGRHPTFREIASFSPFDGTTGTRIADEHHTRSKSAGERCHIPR